MVAVVGVGVVVGGGLEVVGVTVVIAFVVLWVVVRVRYDSLFTIGHVVLRWVVMVVVGVMSLYVLCLWYVLFPVSRHPCSLGAALVW